MKCLLEPLRQSEASAYGKLRYSRSRRKDKSYEATHSFHTPTTGPPWARWPPKIIPQISRTIPNFSSLVYSSLHGTPSCSSCLTSLGTPPPVLSSCTEPIQSGRLNGWLSQQIEWDTSNWCIYHCYQSKCCMKAIQEAGYSPGGGYVWCEKRMMKLFIIWIILTC